MLLVYGALVMGGIETFFVRLMKSRFEKGLRTKILLTQPEIRSQPELLNEARKYAEVVFIQQLFAMPSVALKAIPKAFFPLLPVRQEQVSLLLAHVDIIHVSDAFSGILALSLAEKVNKKIPVTVGFYHSKEFLWGASRPLPYFERINRHVVFNCLPRDNLIIFNEAFIPLYQKHGIDLNGANCFPIGVVEGTASDEISSSANKKDDNRLKVVSVGRLVDFKTYNKWMIQLVARLKIAGFCVEYHIYGKGPLESLLRKYAEQLGIADLVHFHGLLNYADFNSTVALYDVFVGSGTAIIQAAAIGVPAIIGIENASEPLSYGYITDVPGFSYNEDGLYEKVTVEKLLQSFCRMPDEEKAALKLKHIRKAQTFSMNACVENFEYAQQKAMPVDLKQVPLFRYCMSLLINVVLAKLVKTHLLRFKYVG